MWRAPFHFKTVRQPETQSPGTQTRASTPPCERGGLVAAGQGFDLFGQFFDLLGFLDHGEAEDVLGFGFLDGVFEFDGQGVEFFDVVVDLGLVALEHDFGIEAYRRREGSVRRDTGRRNLRHGVLRSALLRGSEMKRGEKTGGKDERRSGQFGNEISFLKVDHGVTPVRKARAGGVLQ